MDMVDIEVDIDEVDHSDQVEFLVQSMLVQRECSGRGGLSHQLSTAGGIYL